MDLKEIITEHPDFPKPGITFRDFAPLLRDPEALSFITRRLVERFPPDMVDIVAGIESRGFVLGTAMAVRYNKGMIMIRKAGKTPGETESISYDLEYGSDKIEMRRDALSPGRRVLVCDDLLATGGTARAAADLVIGAGGIVAGLAFIIELGGLGGRERIGGHQIESLVVY